MITFEVLTIANLKLLRYLFNHISSTLLPFMRHAHLQLLISVRSLMSMVIPIAAHSLYINLGMGWGNTLLAVIGLLFVPSSAYGDEI